MFFFFSPKVVEENGRITVSNISTRAMTYDIHRVFKTSRVNKYLFTEITRNGFVIESFFALELFYIFSDLVENRRLSSNARTLKRICDLLKQNTWLRDIDADLPGRLDLSRLNNMAIPPLPFQMKFLENYSVTVDRYHLFGMLLAGTAGSGKTYTTLALAECRNADRIVIICPSHAVYQVWEDNILRSYKVRQSYWIASEGKPYKGERHLIYHYEALELALKMVFDIRHGRVVCILDESHNLTEMKTLRTQRFIQLAYDLRSTDIILASGTPIKALALETIPLFMAIDPLFTETVMERFKRLYQGEANAATDILAHRLGIVSHSIQKSDLNLDKPIFKDIKVVIPNGDQFTLKTIAKDMEDFVRTQTAKYKESAKHDREVFDQCLAIAESEIFNPELGERTLRIRTVEHEKYLELVKRLSRANDTGDLRSMVEEMAFCNRYEKEMIIPNLPSKELRDRFKQVKSLVKYRSLKIRGECLGRVLGRKRIDAHVAMTPHIDYEAIFDSTTKKTVVFTSYVEVVETCEATLKKQHYKPVTIYAKTNHQLNERIGAFESDKDVNPLIATYASLSTAVPLVMADTMLIINAPFRNYVLEQTISRIHRLGATTQTVVYTAQLDTGNEPNISSRTVDILKWSQDQIEKIMKIDVPFKIEDTEMDTISMEGFDDGFAINDLSVALAEYCSSTSRSQIPKAFLDW